MKRGKNMATANQRVRVLRILEYTGDLETILNTLAKGAVPANGEHSVMNKMTIKSGLVGFPEFDYHISNLPPEETPDAQR
jgi:hypothetical protein